MIDAENQKAVCAISCWETAMLVAKGRLSLSLDIAEWIERALLYPGMRLLPLEPDICVLSIRLPGEFHGDPADRMIAATCLKHGAPLVSADEKIRSWAKVRVIW